MNTTITSSSHHHHISKPCYAAVAALVLFATLPSVALTSPLHTDDMPEKEPAQGWTPPAITITASSSASVRGSSVVFRTW